MCDGSMSHEKRFQISAERSGIAGHMMSNYDGVLKIDSEVGNKKVYDPRSYLKVAEAAMAERVQQTCEELRSVGKTIGTG